MQSSHHCVKPEMDPMSAGFQLCKDGFVYYKDSPLYLPPKERGCLQLLLDAWPEMVSKNDFAEHVWAGRMSGESLTRCIKQLRRALSTIASVQIDSLYGRGYRLRIFSDNGNAATISPQSIHTRLYDTALASPALVEACLHVQQLLARCSPAALDQAESMIRNVIAKAPDYMAAKLTLAQCIADKIGYGMEARHSLIEDGLKLLESVQHVAPQTSGLLSQIGRLLDCKWHFDEARLKHEQALSASPDDAVTHFHYGLHLLATNAPREATGAFRRAAELNPFSPNLSVMFARATALAGEYPGDTVMQARSIYQAFPHSQQAYLYLLSALALHEPQPEIAQAIRHMAPKNSSWAFASGTISYILARCGDGDGALEIIASQSMQSASARATHSAALVALGLVDKAMDCVKDAADAGCGPLPILINASENAALNQHPEYFAVCARIFAHGTT